VLIKSGTFWRLPSTVLPACPAGITIGAYGTGANPILAASAVKSAAWTLTAGTTYQVAHPRNDAWFFGGQPGNGAVVATANPRGVPYGTRLTYATSAANCEATPLTSYWDGSYAYVNLGGADPNSLVMEYSNLDYLIGAQGPSGVGGGVNPINLLDLGLANAGVANLAYFVFPGVNGMSVQQLVSDQSGSAYGYSTGQPPASVWINGANGSAVASGGVPGAATAPLRNFYMNQVRSINGWCDAFDLLGLDNALVENCVGDNCYLGVALWNNVTNSEFRKLQMTNMNQPAVFQGNTGYPACGLGAWQTGSGGVNGSYWNNRITGCLFANTLHCQLDIDAGTGWVIDHNVFWGTSLQTTSAPYGFNVSLGTGSTAYNNNVTEACLTNNVFASPNADTPGAINQSGAQTTIHGDCNYYMQATGDGQFRMNPSAGQTNTLAAWQAAFPNMDQHSVALDSVADPAAQVGYAMPDYSTAPCNYAGAAAAYLDPAQISVRPASGSPLIAGGTAFWTDDTPAPTLAPAVTTGTQTGWAAQAYWVVTTGVTKTGETLASPASRVTLTASTGPVVAAPAAGSNWDAWNVYMSDSTEQGPFWKQNGPPIPTGTAWSGPAGPMVAGVLSGTPGTPGPNVGSPPTRGPITFPPEDIYGVAFGPTVGETGTDIGCVCVT
jgi:hypothetical protein